VSSPTSAPSPRTAPAPIVARCPRRTESPSTANGPTCTSSPRPTLSPRNASGETPAAAKAADGRARESRRAPRTAQVPPERSVRQAGSRRREHRARPGRLGRVAIPRVGQEREVLRSRLLEGGDAPDLALRVAHDPSAEAGRQVTSRYSSRIELLRGNGREEAPGYFFFSGVVGGDAGGAVPFPRPSRPVRPAARGTSC